MDCLTADLILQSTRRTFASCDTEPLPLITVGGNQGNTSEIERTNRNDAGRTAERTQEPADTQAPIPHRLRQDRFLPASGPRTMRHGPAGGILPEVLTCARQDV